MGRVLEKVTDKILDVITSVSAKLMSVQFIVAISETMQVVISIILIGSFGCLVTYLDVGPWQNIVTGVPYLVDICGKLQLITLGSFSFYVVIILTYIYASKLNMKESVAYVPIAAVVFMTATPCDWNGVPVEWLETSGLFSALMIGAIVPRLMQFMIRKKICIRMPNVVPKFVEDSFEILIPGLILLTFSGVLDTILEYSPLGCLRSIIYSVIQTSVSSIGLSLGGHIITCILAATIMWCGLHAGTIGNLVIPLLIAASAESLAVYTAGQEIPNIITQEFFNLTLPGMTGYLLIPAVLMALACRSKQLKSVGRLAVILAVFGIGESVLLGVLVMLNPLLYLLMIPSIIVNQVLTYTAMVIGLIGCSTGVILPWTTPPVLYPLSANSTSARVAALNVIIILIDIIIWLPFVKAYNRNIVLKEMEAEK